MRRSLSWNKAVGNKSALNAVTLTLQNVLLDDSQSVLGFSLFWSFWVLMIWLRSWSESEYVKRRFCSSGFSVAHELIFWCWHIFWCWCWYWYSDADSIRVSTNTQHNFWVAYMSYINLIIHLILYFVIIKTLTEGCRIKLCSNNLPLFDDDKNQIFSIEIKE